MTVNKSASLLCLALPLALFAAGCQKDAAEEADASPATGDTATEMPAEPAVDASTDTKTVEPAPPPTPVPGTDAAIVEDHSTPTAAAPSFDAKAFAGHFVSGATKLQITADGMFTLEIDGSTVNGTWTLQPGGKQVTLDPDSKGETDRQLEIVSNDSVKIVGGATLTRHNDAQ